MAEYPSAGRGTHFAHKLVRLMLRTCAAQEIGSDGFMLVTAIAHTEDGKRYSDAVTFWNDQLMSVLGFSRGQLERARAKAIKGGWLHYEAGGKGKVGRYWSEVPQRFSTIGDGTTDCDADVFLSKNAHENGMMRKNAHPNGREPGENRETSAHHSYLLPNPKDSLSSAEVAPIVNASPPLRRAVDLWNRYWQETYGEGRPDSPTRVETMLSQCLSAGWDADKIVESIHASIGWRAQSWRDPEANYDELAKARNRAAAPKTFNGQADPRGNLAAVASWLDSKTKGEAPNGET